jgi:hypothetical protein
VREVWEKGMQTAEVEKKACRRREKACRVKEKVKGHAKVGRKMRAAGIESYYE